jgi:hypothetical protein
MFFEAREVPAMGLRFWTGGRPVSHPDQALLG